MRVVFTRTIVDARKPRPQRAPDKPHEIGPNLALASIGFAKLLQTQVSGPAAEYSYQSLAPTWLTADQSYVLALYQGANDGYFYGPLSSHHLDSRIGFLGMRFCNECGQNTYPTNRLEGILYGMPTFQFFTYKHPALALAQTAPVCANSTLCDSDCTPAQCGDGHTNPVAGEACDDGNTDETDACRNHCALPSCGDGLVQEDVEACDDGNDDDTDACLSTCLLASCGDGLVQAGVEACDDGNDDETDDCLSSCELPEPPAEEPDAGVPPGEGDGDGDGDGDGEEPAAGDGDGDGDVDAGPVDPTAPKKHDSGCSLSAPSAGDERGLFAWLALGLGLVASRRRRRA